MAAKRCKANVGTRKQPRPCGEPVADGMLAACAAHKLALIPTSVPGIYYRGGQYVVVWRHRGKQHKSFHRTMAEAREAKGRRDGGDRKQPTRELLEDYAPAWIDGYSGRTARGFTDQARDDYRRTLDQYVIPFFAGRKLADIDPPDVRRFVRHLEDHGLAPASVVKNLTPLKAMFATAVEDGALRSNPAAGLRVNSRRDDEDGEEQEVKAMTREELGRLLAALPAAWRPFFELLAKMGLRISEALGLDWSDVEFGARPVLHVRRQYYRGTLKKLKTRTGKRDLPLPAGLARGLWAARPAGARGPVFATGEGTRYSDRNVCRILDRASGREDKKATERALAEGRPLPAPREHAGMPWVHFHTFRHTCASMLFAGGKNIKQVADWLGHRDPAFTLRTYVHLMDDGLGEADFLDTMVGNGWATQAPETAATDEAPVAAEGAG
jgi:integrase